MADVAHSLSNDYNTDSTQTDADNSCPLDGTISSLKWEDSGIVVASGPLTPEDETRPLDAGRQSGTTTVNKLDQQQRQYRRRSSAETYSFSSDGGQQDCNGGGAWLSDGDDGNVQTQGHAGAGHEESVENVASGSSDGRPSVGSSPGQDDSSRDLEPPSVAKPERPRVEFRKGIRCSDVIKAIEILTTAYRLPDVTFRQCYRQLPYWGPTDRYCGLSFTRRHGDTVDSCRDLKEMCVSIERRHREIAEILRKLLELDAANKAEAEALVRTTLADDRGGASNTGSPLSVSGAPFEPRESTAAAEIVHCSSPAKEDVELMATEQDNAATCASRPLKRRNPFSRAVHALRKRFARPGQHGVPAAA